MEIVYLITAFVFGICFGSFCNVIIYRMPLGKSINFPASHCPKCSHQLKFYHNIPLFSWVFLRGSCAFCKEKISIRYPLVEFFAGILAILAICICEFDLFKAVFLGLTLILLLTLSIIDFKFHAVPEIPLMATLVFGIAYAWQDEIMANFSLNSPLFMALVFAGGITIIKSFVSAWINRKNTGEIQESMGDADTIIIALIGAFFGGALGLVCIFLAAVLQLVLHLILKNKSQEAPFIPALSLGILICLVFRAEILNLINAYLQTMGI